MGTKESMSYERESCVPQGEPLNEPMLLISDLAVGNKIANLNRRSIYKNAENPYTFLPNVGSKTNTPLVGKQPVRLSRKRLLSLKGENMFLAIFTGRKR